MELSFGKLSLLLIIAICVLVSPGTEAKPRSSNHNHWKPSDPRCSGANGQGGFDFRFKRHVATNNNGQGHYWRFNANAGSCDMIHGNYGKDNSVFSSIGECDRVCRNVYHFS